MRRVSNILHCNFFPMLHTFTSTLFLLLSLQYDHRIIFIWAPTISNSYTIYNSPAALARASELWKTIACSPPLLLQVALVDAVGEKRSQNQPGTSTEYPNWRIPLADENGHVVHTDEVFKSSRVLSMAAVMQGK